MSLQEKIDKYKCYWLKTYLKELLSIGDLKTYNRVKCVAYYFPEILNNIPMGDFKTAMKYSNETYICLGLEDTRYTVLDKLYKDKNGGADFEPVEWGESRYITIDDLCKFFKI